ncbi:P-type ATPase [Streptomyces alkaliphilus]|uniref:P-type ATPase n=1 Tax=Streptomyces alkaliphilus TaxID=1472722 RepID=UPI002B1EF7C9|nr:hypothetical protein [Streptomyces alkaliphilus]
MERSPRLARRRVGDRLVEVTPADVVPGDLLMVGPGEAVPVDGRVESAEAVLDESALTGESARVEHARGAMVSSGTVNAGAAFTMRATAVEADSAWARLVLLARRAGAERPGGLAGRAIERVDLERVAAQPSQQPLAPDGGIAACVRIATLREYRDSHR